MKRALLSAVAVLLSLLALAPAALAITGAQMTAFVYSDATIACVSTNYCKHVNYPPGLRGIGNGWWIGWDTFYLYTGGVYQLKEERNRNGGVVWENVYRIG